MFISHESENGVLRVVLLRDLDVSTRAAAAVQVEGLLSAHQPRQVRWQWPTASPSSASLSILARARRLCDDLGISLTIADAAAPVRTESRASAAEPVAV
ncbi:hypothetical protein ACIOMM_34240 [Streptomyces sp. NPDC087908]|uniref:hypothetical protein n=1 Tax=unclassified Streptomyces TaxID=2593676 RepID=UPI0011CDB5E2|nr:hypothetical protein [Streptomyces sp. adm13(2018)]TXS12191.1 hypothetical protein EAO70_28060 [Streptomyces sp. adm13(2018)]